MVRRVVLGGGVPLVGPQEELRGSSRYTPKGITSSPRRESKDFRVLREQREKRFRVRE